MKALLAAALVAAIALPNAWAQEGARAQERGTVLIFAAAPSASQQQASAHAQRMAAIEAFGQANAAAFDRRMAAMDLSQRRVMEGVTERTRDTGAAASDASHRRFINSIRGEHTVATPSGLTLQVDNGHDRYFVEEASGRYVGADAHADLDSLRRLGLDPDDYVEAEIRMTVRLPLLAAFALVLCACEGRAPEPPIGAPAKVDPKVIIREPQWVKKPTPAEIAALRPAAAKDFKLSAVANLWCTAKADGTLDACRLDWQDPPGMGFGEAALQTAPLWKMAPSDSHGLVDGRPVEAQVTWPRR